MSVFSHRAALVLMTALLVGACTYGGGVDNPVTRKATWFSYIGGEDIRATCAPGRPAQYRLIYNGRWDEQVRAYDLKRSATGSGAALFTQVFGGGGNVATFNPLDPTGPWRGQSDERRLSEAEYLALIRGIEASDFGQPSPQGLTLPSWGFYWAVSACAEGRFHFNAWLYPSERFEGIRFAGLFFAVDGTEIAVNQPRPLNAALYRLGNGYQGFDLRVGQNGLVGNFGLF